MRIRRANYSDAPAACSVLRRSISELCIADHCDDPLVVANWLANKTPENLSLWMDQSDVFVAERDHSIVAVSAMTRDGWITLNYVLPEARFQGISKALVMHMEGHALERGCSVCRLETTKTAAHFYRKLGYATETAEEPNRLYKTLKRV